MVIKNEINNDVLWNRLHNNSEDEIFAYINDKSRIFQSKPFRRLRKKTQVFTDPNNDHICTRLEHSVLVASIAERICLELIRKQGAILEPALAFAIGIGHDLGHTPFGHAGEKMLDCISSSYLKKHFSHSVHGLRVVDSLSNLGPEYSDKGLDLTFAVRDGIAFHDGDKEFNPLSPRTLNDLAQLNLIGERQKSDVPSTFEGCVVRISDRIAYLTRDFEDARLAIDIPKDLVDKYQKILGTTVDGQISLLINDLVENSKEDLRFSPVITNTLNEFMKTSDDFIYKSKVKQKYEENIPRIILIIFGYLMNLVKINGYDVHAYTLKPWLEKKFGNYVDNLKNFYEGDKQNRAQIAIDYIAGMTDNFALQWIYYLKNEDLSPSFNFNLAFRKKS